MKSDCVINDEEIKIASYIIYSTHSLSHTVVRCLVVFFLYSLIRILMLCLLFFILSHSLSLSLSLCPWRWCRMCLHAHHWSHEYFSMAKDFISKSLFSIHLNFALSLALSVFLFCVIRNLVWAFFCFLLVALILSSIIQSYIFTIVANARPWNEILPIKYIHILGPIFLAVLREDPRDKAANDIN